MADSLRCTSLLLLLLVAGCGPTWQRHAVPRELADRAVLPGFPATIRTWGDEASPEFQEACYVQAIEQARAYYAAHPDRRPPATHAVLAISGGGEDGAFGAGLLTGWTAAGDRPEFALVTGISTGAMAAPMAFLGPPYDQRLKEAYTRVTRRDLFERRSFFALLRSDAATDNRPMRKLLERYVDEAMVEAVAAEHRRGRRLLVGTTNLDAQRPVIWDLGAIAASGHPRRLELFRDVMRASASIPGIFQPVYIQVEVDGRSYEEMHVDGGTTNQVFLLGAGVDVERLKRAGPPEFAGRPSHVYVIRNSRLTPEWQEVRPFLPDVVARAVSTLIKSQGAGDVVRLYVRAREYGMEFHLASLPPDFDVPLKEAFDREYMNALYQAGFELGRAGYAWQRDPPGFSARGRPTTLPATHPATLPRAQPLAEPAGAR